MRILLTTIAAFENLMQYVGYSKLNSILAADNMIDNLIKKSLFSLI